MKILIMALLLYASSSSYSDCYSKLDGLTKNMVLLSDREMEVLIEKRRTDFRKDGGEDRIISNLKSEEDFVALTSELYFTYIFDYLVRNRELDLIQKILNTGIDPSQHDKFGESPLQIVAFSGNNVVLEILKQNDIHFVLNKKKYEMVESYFICFKNNRRG